MSLLNTTTKGLCCILLPSSKNKSINYIDGFFKKSIALFYFTLQFNYTTQSCQNEYFIPSRNGVMPIPLTKLLPLVMVHPQRYGLI